MVANFEMNLTARRWSTPPITTAIATNSSRRAKSVHFADAKGLALVSTYFFVSERKSWHYHQEKYGRERKQKTKSKSIDERTILLNFKSPLPRKQFDDNVSISNVSLERTYCNRNGIYGRVQVKNIAFEKQIFVRYSFNSWRTILEQRASFIPGASVGNTDTFFFHIPPPCVRKSNENKLEFAISYKVDGEIYWDNNFGDNYRLIYIS